MNLTTPFLLAASGLVLLATLAVSEEGDEFPISIECGGRGEVLDAIFIEGTSALSKYHAVRNALSDLQELFQCDPTCVVSCNLDGVLVEDSSGDAIDMGFPYNPNWQFSMSSAGHHGAQFNFPAGSRVSTGCSPCLD